RGPDHADLSAPTPHVLQAVDLDLSTVNCAEDWSESRGGCLLHGFGASAQDLVSLAPALGGAQHWVFPHAPTPISVGGMAYGRAWFPRETEELQQALFGGYFLSLRTLEPAGLAQAGWEVRQLVDGRNLAWETLILGGFSQGAMVAAEVLRQGLENPALPLPAVVLLFSGALTAQSWWEGLNVAERSPRNPDYTTAPEDPTAPLPRIFQSHGTLDPVLPISEGEALRDTLHGAGFVVDWHQFTGRHEIPEGVVRAAASHTRSI
ncbi:MAG: alpha/beta hydrolase, partial [Alkalispirochaeta sp.]